MGNCPSWGLSGGELPYSGRGVDPSGKHKALGGGGQALFVNNRLPPQCFVLLRSRRRPLYSGEVSQWVIVLVASRPGEKLSGWE